MLVLVFIYILIRSVACAGIFNHKPNPHPLSPRRNLTPEWVGVSPELRFMYNLHIENSKRHELENELQFEVGQTITLNCSSLIEADTKLTLSKLRWEVDKFNLTSNEKSTSSFEYITLTLTPDRDYNGTNVVCVGEDKDGQLISKNVTLLLKNTTSVTKPLKLISGIEGSPLKTPEKDYHCILEKNSIWTKFNNLSNVLIDQLRLDDNGTAVLCANLSHTERVQKRPNYENFDLYVKRWIVVVTKVQLDNDTRVTTENNIEVKKDENDRRVKQGKNQENDKGVKQEGNDKEVKQAKNQENDIEVKKDKNQENYNGVKQEGNHEVKQDENYKGVKQGQQDKDPKSQSNTDPLPIIGVAIGVFALLLVLLIAIIVYFRRKFLELKIMNHVYAEPQYDAMTAHRKYSTIEVMMRNLKPCLPPRNKDHAKDVEDSGIQVTNSGYVSSESFQIQADGGQINMNNYTIMQ